MMKVLSGFRSYGRHVVSSLARSVDSPVLFLKHWFFDSLNFVIFILAGFLFSSSYESSSRKLFAVTDSVIGGSLETVSLFNAALNSFYLRVFLLVIAVVASWLLSYSFTRRWIFSSLYGVHHKMRFSSLFWLSVVWLFLAGLLGGIFIYLLTPLVYPVLQSLNRFLAYAWLFSPVALYFFCSSGVWFSFLKHQSVVRGLQGLFEPFARVHKLLLPLLGALLVLFLLLLFIGPLLAQSSTVLSWILISVFLVAPWVSWWRRFFFELERGVE